MDQAVSVMTLTRMTADEARECVTAINTHLNSARALLLDLYEREGWRVLGYDSWRECVVAEFGVSERNLYYQLQAAEIERDIGVLQNFANAPIPEYRLRPLADLPTSDERRAAWIEAVETAPERGVTQTHVQSVVERRLETSRLPLDSPPAPVAEPEFLLESPAPTDPVSELPASELLVPNSPRLAVHYSSESSEWYTPNHIIERVMETLGDIDLDPCADPDCNIPAVAHYTQQDDGLVRSWRGRIYMNPPYGNEIKDWVSKLRAEFDCGNTIAAIALLPARMDTAWWRVVRDFPFCIVHGRLKFSGQDNSAPFPSVLVYLGANIDRFADVFGDIGDIYRRYRKGAA